jgi:hypothetical protein
MNYEIHTTALRALIDNPQDWQPWRSAAAHEDLKQLLAGIDSLQQQLSEAQKRDGNWLDKWGCCRVCNGEIPHGHTLNCDIFKLEQERDAAQARCAEKDDLITELLKQFSPEHMNYVSGTTLGSELKAVIGADGSDLFKKLAEKDEALRRALHALTINQGVWSTDQKPNDETLFWQANDADEIRAIKAALSPAVNEKENKRTHCTALIDMDEICGEPLPCPYHKPASRAVSEKGEKE